MKKFHRKYVLPIPSKLEESRLIEVEFYLIFKHLYDHLKNTNKKSYELTVNSIADFCGLEIYTFLFPLEQLRKISNRPSKEEIVLTLMYFGLSYREIYHLFRIHPDTTRKYLKRYISVRKPNLRPRITPAIKKDIITALKAIDELFVPFIEKTLISSKRKQYFSLWESFEEEADDF